MPGSSLFSEAINAKSQEISHLPLQGIVGFPLNMSSAVSYLPVHGSDAYSSRIHPISMPL
jgi:hypothetical protein